MIFFSHNADKLENFITFMKKKRILDDKSIGESKEIECKRSSHFRITDYCNRKTRDRLVRRLKIPIRLVALVGAAARATKEGR